MEYAISFDQLSSCMLLILLVPTLPVGSHCSLRGGIYS
jgi:hypothetical protein